MCVCEQQLPYIVADIGGTNARFGLITGVDTDNHSFTLEHAQTYPSASFDGIEQAVSTYLETIKDYKVKNACLAVAGPVSGDDIKLTNLKWHINVPTAKKYLGFEQLLIINDFAAYAYAIRYVDDKYLRVLKPGTAIESAPKAVIGPGTGFGTASLLTIGDTVYAQALEGGHMSLAATTALQAAVKEYLSRRFELVSIERVFSGPGLRYLYYALAAVEGTRAQKLSTAEISQYALDGKDDLCVRTLTLFCSWLGSVTGDLTLALGAKGGVYMGGGILPRIADFLLETDFVERFCAKDQMSHFLEDIPIQLVMEGNSALLGAAASFVTCCCKPAKG